jgi:hypothetical protein
MCTPTLDTDSIIFVIAVEMFYVFTALYTIWFFYQNLPDDPSIHEFKKKVFIRYIVYLIATVVMFVCLGVSNVGIEIFKGRPNSNAILVSWIIIGNVATCMAPVILVGARLKNPKIY